jgi:hypothetical protein
VKQANITALSAFWRAERAEIDVDRACSDGRRAAHIAAQANDARLLLFLFEGIHRKQCFCVVVVVAFFIALNVSVCVCVVGADLNLATSDARKTTPLHLVIEARDVEATCDVDALALIKHHRSKHRSLRRLSESGHHVSSSSLTTTTTASSSSHRRLRRHSTSMPSLES